MITKNNQEKIIQDWWTIFLGEDTDIPARLTLEEENEAWATAAANAASMREEWYDTYLDSLEELYGPLFQHPVQTLNDINEEFRRCFMIDQGTNTTIRKVA